MSNTPPVEALVILKRMQENLKQSKQLTMEFVHMGAQLSSIYGMSTDEITNWLENGRSYV